MQQFGKIWVPLSYAERERGRAPRTGEVATVRSDPDWSLAWAGNAREHTDPIVDKESGSDGIKLYDDMDRKDPQLSSYVQTRINGVLCKDRRIVPGDDSDAAKQLAADAQAMFDRIDDFESDLREILRAVSHGFSVSELMWTRRGDAWDIADLVSRPQRRFKFDTDWQLLMLTRDDQTEGEPVEKRYPRKFLVYTHGRAGMDRYGKGEYQYCYWPYFFKKHAVKFWAIFIEKRSMPIPVARYDPEQSTSDKRADIKAALRDFVHDTGILLPADVELEFLQVTSTVPVNTLNGFVEVMDQWQAQRILGQTLTTGKGQAGLGQGGVASQHGQVRQEYIESDAKELLPTLNLALRWWVDLNSGPQDRYPRWQIDYEPPEDLKTAADVDRIVIGELGLPVAAVDVYEKYGWRKPEDGDELLAAPPSPPAGGGEEEAFAELDWRGRAVRRFDRDTRRLTRESVDDGLSFFGDWRKALEAHLKKKVG